MFNTTIIKKTIIGIMQSSGGFSEPISRVLGLRVRTAAGNSLTISHDDTNAKLKTATGELQLEGAGGVAFIGGIIIPSGTTLQRPIIAKPTIYMDTDEGEMIWHSGDLVWKTFGGFEV